MKTTDKSIARTAVAALLLAGAAMFAVPASAVQPDETAEEEVQETEDSDDEINTSYVEIPGEADDIDIPVPDFIHRNANHIILNGADWKTLANSFRASATRPVSIVHIGDSHLQADISSGTTRELLQYDFGNAGRGLVTPLKISGTNQPSNYIFQSTGSWIPNKLMSQTWRQTVGFTGSSIRPASNSGQLSLGTPDKDDYNPFTSVTVFHSGKLSVNNVTDASGNRIPFRAIPSRDYTQLIFTSPQTRVNLDFSSAGDLTVFGANLSGDRPGLFYHAIGNNGAAYETYNRIGNVGAGIAPLSPDLVIISLGTNEAFGKLNTAGFTRAVDRLVRNIRNANPGAAILLTTPMECQRSVTQTTKVRVKSKRRRKGKARYRTINKKTRSYAVNRNILPLRNAILDYGKQNGIPVYDWYEVAGGSGASTSWINRGLFAGDRVHHSRQGYSLEGRLVYDAIMDAIRSAD